MKLTRPNKIVSRAATALALGALLAPATVFFTGCHTTVNTVENAEQQAEIKPEKMKHILTDRRLAKEIQPISLIEGVADDGVSLKVQLRVRNGRRGPVKVNYKVEWYDKQGLAVAGYTPPLLSVHLLGRETKPIITIAPSPKAVDYKFHFIRFVED
jgi:uncharacterized protein YcfL